MVRDNTRAGGLGRVPCRYTRVSVDIAEPVHTVTLKQTIVMTTSPRDEPPGRIARFEQNTAAVPVTTYWRSPPSLFRPITSALSLGDRRYSEQRLMPGDDVTIVGRITETGDGIDPLIVSDLSAGQTLLRMAKTSLIGLCIGVVVVLLGLALVLL